MLHFGWQRALRDAARPSRAVRAVALGMLMAAPEVWAQQPRPDSTRRWFTSASVGLFGAPELVTVGVQWTGAMPSLIVPDFAVGTLPRGFVEGVVVLGGRAGAALPLRVANGATLLPGVGLSAIGGAGAGGGGGGTWGYNTGASLVLLNERGVGLRMGVTWHRFEWDGSIWLVEVGIARGPRRGSE